MSSMAMVPEVPEVPEAPVVRETTTRSTVAWIVAALGGSAVLGLLGGLIWGEYAPRVMLRQVRTGAAQVINAESHAFFGADVWFCGIAVVAGLLTGILGYRFAVSPRSGYARAAVSGAILLGAVAGGFVMLWLGEQIGLSAFNHHLASSPVGTVYDASLGLGAKTALAFWPLLTAIVLTIAEWGTAPTRRRPLPPD